MNGLRSLPVEKKTAGFEEVYTSPAAAAMDGAPDGAGASYALDLCARIARCTDVEGTITRLFLSAGTRQVHALLRMEMESLGMQVRVDAAGNLRGMYAGQSADAPVLLTGSHVDTVPDAGRFDGVLGVAIALAAVRALGRRRLRFAIEVIAFSEEEGIRFRLPYLGSRALVRTLGVQELARVDEAGVSVAEAIDRFRLNVEELGAAAITAGTFAFLEVHIEQGPVLEALGLPLGVVTGVAGQMQVEVIFRGRANHAGTTPMHLRHDALAAAAAWIGCVEALAKRTDGLVATVGTMRVSPGAANVVPGTAVVSVDVRHALDEVRRSAMRDLLAAAEREGGRRGVTVTARELSRQEAVRMETGLVERMAAAVGEAGFPVHRMVSGAGHDAMILAKAVPAAMLFVRTPGGVSHHPDETVAAADVEAAIGVLLSVMERLESSTAEVSG